MSLLISTPEPGTWVWTPDLYSFSSSGEVVIFIGVNSSLRFDSESRSTSKAGYLSGVGPGSDFRSVVRTEAESEVDSDLVTVSFSDSGAGVGAGAGVGSCHSSSV